MRTLSHAEFLAMRRFPGLDGLRAIAAVLVVIVHYGGPRWAWLSGWAGVHIFFVLTGFLITTLALREEERNGKVSLRSFYIRRVFRIMPVYFVVLGIIVALDVLRRQPGNNVRSLWLYYVTFNNDIAGDRLQSIFLYGQSWTLGIEQKFYLVWPFLAFLIAAMAFGRKIAFALAGMAVALLLIPVTGGSSVHYFVILVGCLLALVMHSPKGFAVLRPLTSVPVGLAVAALWVVAHLYIPWGRVTIGEPLTIALYAIPVALLLVVTVSHGPVQWILSRRPMRIVGERSYSLYLIQMVAGLTIAATIPIFAIPRTATVIAVACLAFVMADVLYRWVELPMIGLGKKVLDRSARRRERHVQPVELPARAVPSLAVDQFVDRH